jgi:dihydroorotase
MVRQTLETDAIHQLVDTCFKKYPNGLVTNVQKGQVPSQYQSLARIFHKKAQTSCKSLIEWYV